MSNSAASYQNLENACASFPTHMVLHSIAEEYHLRIPHRNRLLFLACPYESWSRLHRVDESVTFYNHQFDGSQADLTEIYGGVFQDTFCST